MTIAERVYEILNEQGKKQSELADFLGIGRSSVNYWFRVGGSIPSDMIVPVSTFLGVSVNYLVTGVKEPEIKPIASTDLEEDEAELLRVYRLLDREGKVMVLSCAYTHKNRVLDIGERKQTETA